MLNNIAYIGYGFVGRACHQQFKNNVPAIIIDPKVTLLTTKDLAQHVVELIFVAINAPTLEDGTVNTSIIHQIFADLVAINYAGIVVLKSTVPPLQCEEFATLYPSLRYIYSPEFLREATWAQDALHPSQMILAGEIADCMELKHYYLTYSHVSNDTKWTIGIHYNIASLLKYTINCYLASKVTFMNQIHELVGDISGDNPTDTYWTQFTQLLANDPRFGSSHLRVPGTDGQFGYGGSCFPKDVRAMIGFDTQDRLSVLRETEVANTHARLKGKVDKN